MWMHCACVHKCVHTRSLPLGPTLCVTMTIALQAPLSMGFSKQKYWSGLPCRPAGDLPDSVVVVVQLLSCVQLFATPWTVAQQASLSLTISQSLLLSWWCHPTISSSVVSFSSCLLSLPASGSFPDPVVDLKIAHPKLYCYSFLTNHSNGLPRRH